MARTQITRSSTRKLVRFVGHYLQPVGAPPPLVRTP
jgi:hypothetical protein